MKNESKLSKVFNLLLDFLNEFFNTAIMVALVGVGVEFIWNIWNIGTIGKVCDVAIVFCAIVRGVLSVLYKKDNQ